MINQDALHAAMHQNLTALNEILPELVKTHAGMFALMRDGSIVQLFHSHNDAKMHGETSFIDGIYSIFEVSDQLEALDSLVTAEIDSGSQSGELTVSSADNISNLQASQDSFPRTIVFASQKGGAGKTTLCGHVAVQAELAGEGPVALIDTDPQGSLADWWNVRESETPLFVKTHFSQLAKDLAALGEQGIRIVFIDTPPAVTDTIREVVGFADLVVIPTRPSPHDLRAVGATIDIIEDQQKQLIFVVNAATARARITSDSAVALSQHGTVAPVTVHQRIDFATSMINGNTVMEMNHESRSAQEISDLWDYIELRLDKIEQQRPNRRGNVIPFQGVERRTLDRGRGFGRRVAARPFGKRLSE